MAPIIILTIGVSGTFGTPPKGGVSRLSRFSPEFMAEHLGGPFPFVPF